MSILYIWGLFLFLCFLTFAFVYPFFLKKIFDLTFYKHLCQMSYLCCGNSIPFSYLSTFEEKKKAYSVFSLSTSVRGTNKLPPNLNFLKVYFREKDRRKVKSYLCNCKHDILDTSYVRIYILQ